MGVVKYSGPVASFYCPTEATIRSLKVHFSPKQLGSGTPSPENVREIEGWDGVEVSHTGKNLANSQLFEKNKYIPASGNVGNLNGFMITNFISVKYLHTYIYSGIDTFGAINIRVHGYDIDKNWIKQVQLDGANGKPYNFLITINDENIKFIRISTAIDDHFQFEESLTATSYEPYRGETHQIEFPGVRKNLLDINKLFSEGTTNSSREGITRIQIPVSNGTYTISTNVIDNDDTNIASVFAWVNGLTPETVPTSSGSGVFKDAPRTINITNGIISIGIRTRSSSYLTWTAETFSPYYIQLESGDTATAYEPYTNTVYGGWVDLISGEVCEEYEKKVFDGSEDWKLNTWSKNGIYIQHREVDFENRVVPYVGTTANELYCNMLQSLAPQYYINTNKAIAIVGGDYLPNYTYLLIYNSEWGQTVEEYKTTIKALYDNGTPLEVVAKRKTGFFQYYHFPPNSSELKTFLGQNNVWSNADYVEVEYDLHETQDILARKQFIMANQPHIVKPAAAPLQNFETNMVAPLKECKLYFEPVQEGEGTPSPDNVRPITGWTWLKVYRTGKNMLDELFLSDYANYPIGGAYGYRYTDPIFLEPNTTYQFSFAIPQKKYETKRYWAVKVYDDAYADINDAGTVRYLVNGTFTAGWSITTGAQGAVRFAVYGGQATLDDIWNNTTVQLEIGSTATVHEPYQGQTIFLDWTDETGTVYGGYVDLINGEIIQEWKSVILNGEEAWSSQSPHTFSGAQYDTIFLTNSYSDMVQGKSGHGLISAMPTAVDPTSISDTGILCGQFGWSDKRFYIFNATQYLDGVSDVTTLKAYLSQNPIQICYKLATPIHYSLSPTQLKTLRGTNNIWSNANGNIELSYWIH